MSTCWCGEPAAPTNPNNHCDKHHWWHWIAFGNTPRSGEGRRKES